jgi:hypothetical protein
VRGDNLIVNSSPLRTFTSLIKESTHYECVQTCYPVNRYGITFAQLTDICENICMFNPNASPYCAECPEIFVIQPAEKRIEQNQLCCDHTGCYAMVTGLECPKIIKPPTGIQFKACCDGNRCYTVPFYQPCPEYRVCFEPCDNICTGLCEVNPQCPHRCLEISKERLVVRWKYWVVEKMRELRVKYKELVEACILRTLQAREAEERYIIEESYKMLGSPEIMYERQHYREISKKH